MTPIFFITFARWTSIVFGAKAALVLQEYYAIPDGEGAVATLDHYTHLIAEIAGGTHPHPRRRLVLKR